MCCFGPRHLQLQARCYRLQSCVSVLHAIEGSVSEHLVACHSLAGQSRPKTVFTSCRCGRAAHGLPHHRYTLTEAEPIWEETAAIEVAQTGESYSSGEDEEDLSDATDFPEQELP